jgi:dynein heavy chain
MNESLAIATIAIFNTVSLKFLPTPAKSHYTFNMRDVSKVFQGVYQADKNYYDNRESIAKLWAHETLRVFSDRLNTDDDRNIFKGLVAE